MNHQYDNYVKDQNRIMQQNWGDQDWIMKEGKDDINWWPDEWIRSYKWEMIGLKDTKLLNKDGKAKTTIEVAPPRSNDRTFEGTVTLHSTMDQRGYNDVQDGLLKVRITIP